MVEEKEAFGIAVYPTKGIFEHLYIYIYIYIHTSCFKRSTTSTRSEVNRAFRDGVPPDLVLQLTAMN